ncbi:MAG: T9SS type A sorting domain-containing protein [Chitinophagaceae bacterium]
MLKIFFTSLSCLCLAISYSQEEIVLSMPDTIIPVFYDSTIGNPELKLTVRDNSKVILSWKAPTTVFEFFSVERSCNGKEFETIGVLKQLSGHSKIEWIDEQPARGKNQYRIRFSRLNGTFLYSGTITTQVGGTVSFRFYPNPADNVLIIRSEQTIDLLIVDGNGKFRISQNQFSGLKMLNISSLEKGIYILHIYNKQSNLHFQEKLVKN